MRGPFPAGQNKRIVVASILQPRASLELELPIANLLRYRLGTYRRERIATRLQQISAESAKLLAGPPTD